MDLTTTTCICTDDCLLNGKSSKFPVDLYCVSLYQICQVLAIAVTGFATRRVKLPLFTQGKAAYVKLKTYL